MTQSDIISVDYPAAGAMTARGVRDITDLIIHHTAGAVTQTPLEIDQEHRNIGDAMIAYNRVITPDGKVYMGRPDNVVPAAAYGRNAESINVVLVGNFQSNDAGYTGPPTPQQLDALDALALLLHQQYPTIVRTIGHYEVATLFFKGDSNYATACPGNRLINMLPDVRAFVAKHLNTH